MLIKNPASFITNFIDSLDEALKELQSNAQLTSIQKKWLSFCLMGMLMLNAVNWAKFERAGLSSYKSSALSWMFHHAKIAWELLLRASVMTVLKQHGVTEGTLVPDESDRARSKRTRFIYKAHKQKDKATGGYVNGQTIVLLLLVTETISFPVGFAFYTPDPVVSAWQKEDDRLKKEGTLKKNRPVKPEKDLDYPS